MNATQKKVLLSLSGGADSTTVLAYYLSKGCKAEAVFFTYGSKQNAQEIICAKSIANHYNVALNEVDLCMVFQNITSAMMSSDIRDIPQSGYDKKTMSQTVVPGRNTLFASTIAAIAESKEFDIVALGVHSGDHYLYPDCRPEYIQSLKKTLELSSDGKITVEAPFLQKSKAEIIQLGLSLHVPYELTRSCYTDQKNACGKCGTCIERLDAFKSNGAIDPVPYTHK